MQPTLDSSTLQTLFAPVRTANAAFKAQYPGESPLRQPVHTVYGGAHLFKRDTAPSLGRAALRALEEAAPDPASFATCFGFAGAPWAETVYARVKSKLVREAVEDFRLDFEDGYGNRPH